MSEEKKSGGFFHFIWKCLVTFAMVYGIAYAIGYDKQLLGFLSNSVLPEMKNTVAPVAQKARAIAGGAVRVAEEKSKVLGDKAKVTIDKAKNAISEKLTAKSDQVEVGDNED